MTAPDPLLKLAREFVQCFTQPGFAHFRHFVSAHAALWGAPHCVTETLRVTLISRLRSNAALYELPPPRRPGQRGRKALRGTKVSARQLYRRRSHWKRLKAHIYGKTVTIQAFVGIVMPSRTLCDTPVLAIIFPQRSGKKMNILFTTDLEMAAVRLLERYAARFKIEDVFDELKTHGGFADCRQRSFRAQRRHVTLCMLAYSLLRLLSLTLRNAEEIEAEPWWHPAGPPSVTRLRRAVAKPMGISFGLPSASKPTEIRALARAA